MVGVLHTFARSAQSKLQVVQMPDRSVCKGLSGIDSGICVCALRNLFCANAPMICSQKERPNRSARKGLRGTEGGFRLGNGK